VGWAKVGQGSSEEHRAIKAPGMSVEENQEPRAALQQHRGPMQLPGTVTHPNIPLCLLKSMWPESEEPTLSQDSGTP
jgi:hypothetical protein